MKKLSKGEFMVCRTEWGWIGGATTENGLAVTVLPQDNEETVRYTLFAKFDSLYQVWNDNLRQFMLCVEKFFTGPPEDFASLILDLSWTTPFQHKVLKEVRGLPYGKVNSYKEIACKIGNPSAVRAVGGALKRNDLPLVIPCHRVIASNGGLGGFTGADLSLKQQLIELEQSFSNTKKKRDS